jgi:TonB dependent receptor/TonB-dependent Receptor Plug Domain
MIKPHLTLRLLTLIAALGSTARLGAETAPAAPAPAASDEVVTLEKLEVSDVPIEENIMPTSRPFGSVYGDSRSIMDTPRNVTIISREQLDAIAIQDVRDFSKLTSSSFTTTNFGAPANPTIRGQYADLYQNGIRRVVTSNGNGLPLNFNSVESVNIIKGPATVVQGGSFYVGGAADLITKQPTFDRTKGTVTGTVGSFDQLRWSADYNIPISEKAATRFSYSGEHSGSYYESGHKRTEALYGALVLKPTDKYELFLNSELFYGDYVENFGINRVTQDLIDNGTYITGVNNNPAPAGPMNFGGYSGTYFDSGLGTLVTGPLGLGFASGGGDAAGIPNGAPTSATPSDPQNAANVVSGYPVTNRVVADGTTKLSRRTRLLKDGDNSLGKMGNFQAIQTFKVNPDFNIVNNTYFNRIERDTVSSYYYSEIVDPAWSVENRTEFRFTADKHTINTGLALRYQEVTAYNNFFFEPASVWDLSRPRSGIDATKSLNFAGSTNFVPGWPGRSATPGTFEGDTNDSSLFTAGLFFQDNIKLTDKITLDLGGRGELVDAKSKDPLADQISAFATPATFDESVIAGNANGSLTYAFTPKLKGYVTYNYSENYGGAVGNGGGIKPTSGKEDLRQPSTLWEVGAKQALLNDKLFIGAAVFHQERIATQLDGSSRNFTYEGFEIEMNYQPSKNFYATLSYSYLDAVSDRPQFDVGNVAYYDGSGDLADGGNYAPHPDNVRFFEIDKGTGRYRIQGLPRNLWSALATYKWDNGFGISSGIVVHTDINNNVAGTLVIPTQYTLDVTFFYTAKTWFARLAILNATDEENWSPPNYVYGNESILADLPIRAELTVGYKF